MVSESEALWRVMLSLLIAGALLIGLPQRLRADRVGGRVSIRSDPSWFWIIMAFVGLPLAVTCLAFLVQPRWVDFGAVDTPEWTRPLGAATGLVGLLLFRWMFRHLGLNVTSTSIPRKNATLVTTGPYQWIRHPMYSAALLMAAAASLLTANVIVMIGGITMFALLVVRSNVEERRLVEKFGPAYQDYQRRTGRFLPRPAGRK